jgi:Arc/MetJ-type ribon-helix-helix transcriptional regulator
MQTTERITITVPKQVAERLREEVAAGAAESVSGLVTSLVEARFERELVARFLVDMAEGAEPITDETRAWVDELMKLADGG